MNEDGTISEIAQNLSDQIDEILVMNIKILIECKKILSCIKKVMRIMETSYGRRR